MARSTLGAVLTGGASRRMGTDKALVEVEGIPMVVRVADALHGGGVANVVCVGGDHEALAALGLETVPDLHPSSGPLGGVCTALAAASAQGLQAVVVAACDQYRLDATVVAALLEALAGEVARSRKIVVAGTDPLLAPLPMAAFVDPVRPLADAAFAAGDRSLRALLARLGTLAVPGLAPSLLVDADHPRDLPQGSWEEPIG